MLECLEKIGGKRIEVIHIVGGGSKNDLLNQFTADACGRPVIAGPVEATVLGNVLMQARAAGEVRSLSELRTVVRESCEARTFEPKRTSATAWAEGRAKFERIARKG
jgi:rhamnulokinase